MAAAQYPEGRRWFLRTATGAAATVLLMGAQALFGASAASGITQDGCCLLGPAPDRLVSDALQGAGPQHQVLVVQ